MIGNIPVTYFGLEDGVLPSNFTDEMILRRGIFNIGVRLNNSLKVESIYQDNTPNGFVEIGDKFEIVSDEGRVKFLMNRRPLSLVRSINFNLKAGDTYLLDFEFLNLDLKIRG